MFGEINALTVLQVDSELHNSRIPLVNGEAINSPERFIAAEISSCQVVGHLAETVATLDAEHCSVVAFVDIFADVLD